MENKELIEQVNKEMATELPVNISLDILQEKLSSHINLLIEKNFEQLISLLYRIDVSEARIKTLLQHNTDKNSGDIIAALIIDRQLQKIKTREQFSKRDDNISDEEKW
ncbi:MAG: hypothetical protein QM791_20475 [Ferruginibacter sp.]